MGDQETLYRLNNEVHQLTIEVADLRAQMKKQRAVTFHSVIYDSATPFKRCEYMNILQKFTNTYPPEWFPEEIMRWYIMAYVDRRGRVFSDRALSNISTSILTAYDDKIKSTCPGIERINGTMFDDIRLETLNITTPILTMLFDWYYHQQEFKSLDNDIMWETVEGASTCRMVSTCVPIEFDIYNVKLPADEIKKRFSFLYDLPTYVEMLTDPEVGEATWRYPSEEV